MLGYPECQAVNAPLNHGNLKNLNDGVTHFMGCVRSSDKASFRQNPNLGHFYPKLEQRIRDEEARIQEVREILEIQEINSDKEKIFAKFRVTLETWVEENTNLPTRKFPAPKLPNTNSEILKEREEAFLLQDLKVNAVYFRKTGNGENSYPAPYDHPDLLPEKFPDQKIPLDQFLQNDSEHNPLMWKCNEDMIRYFHIPANNMEWEAISRYYNEGKPDLGIPYRKQLQGEQKSKTSMLLSRQYWRGLQHGGRPDLPTHTCHMRPRCCPISTDPHNLEPQPRNLVLFMPYMHWETNRRRSRAAEVIRMHGSKPNRWSPFGDVMTDLSHPVGIITDNHTISEDCSEQVKTWLQRRHTGPMPRKITHHMKKDDGMSHLGRILLLAASIYEAMDAYADEKLIEKYLTSQPPLHYRRTLDQFFYWTLRDTRSRDMDQVVYRETAVRPRLLHQEHFKKDLEKEKDKVCPQCTENVRKVPRVVMVDQLWMWILDENTIITCFPKRWGRNKPDPSAVQKCIRTRLRSARIDEVRSVYDLAILIIDQCSRVFFDRTQPSDLQPHVMDSFANAIGRVTNKQTIAFHQFWECTRLASRRYNCHHLPDNGTAKKSQNVLLDINPEGELLREINDILDEIFIMKQVKSQELAVIKAFYKNFSKILYPAIRQEIASDHQLQDDHLTVATSTSRSVSPGPSRSSERSVSIDSNGWTRSSGVELIDGIETQLSDLNDLTEAAENARDGLKDLLTLKQQQASIVEARESVKQGEETLKQGRAIILLTCVTLCFLPLSFFTGFFGMNVQELTGDPPLELYRYSEVLKLMLPISFVIIIGSLLIAFSKLIRASLSQDIHEKQKKEMNKMKAAAIKISLVTKAKTIDKQKGGFVKAPIGVLRGRSLHKHQLLTDVEMANGATQVGN
ncbi:hypothetical protein BGZ60DRAFT_402512 [Tricladium varicosporioides]|nr:hypothetical protein BGZ60DRAFT_402512 [Hymenoscyphus varicosporioides]